MPFDMSTFLLVSSVFSVAASLIALGANGVLFYLIRTVCNESFGLYTNLMTANALNLLVFSLLHSFVQPIISIEKNVIYVFAAKNYLDLPVLVMRLLLAAYGVAYCMSLMLCAVTFIFRFSKVCSPNPNLFATFRHLLYWFTFVVTVGIFWGFCIFHVAVATPYVDQIIKEPLLKQYGMNLTMVTYVAAAYKISDPTTGAETFNLKLILMGLAFLTIIGGSMVVTVYCVWQIARKTRDLQDKTYCYPYEIQRQLFFAQCVQMAIPFCLVCIPIFTIILFPLIVENGNVAFSVVSILVAIYPVLDPIAIMMIITQYRQTLASCFSIKYYP